jgi:hypothetical protein
MRSKKQLFGLSQLQGFAQYGEGCEFYIFQPVACEEVDVTHSWNEFSLRHLPFKSPRNISLTSKVSDYGRAYAS